MQIETNVVKPEISTFLNETLYRIIEIDNELELESSIHSIEEYLKSTNGEGRTEEDKDQCFGIATERYKKYTSILKGLKMNFWVNRPQFKFLTDLILLKLEYDVDDVFIAIELTNLMAEVKNTKFTNDIEVKSIKVDPTEITKIYHLIAKHKVKGLSADAYSFSRILRRIGEIAKIVRYYDNKAKEMSESIKNWAVSSLSQVSEVVSDDLPKEEESLTKD